MRQKESLGLILLIALIIVGSGMYLYKINFISDVPVGVPEDNQGQAVTRSEVSARNVEIQSAMITFQDYGINNEDDFDYMCTSGGFINERNPELKEISDRIVKNLVIDETTGQFASTPDEAGITCLSNPDTWVLFAPLNGSNGNGYYCVDSTGAHGVAGFDRDSMACLTNETQEL